VRISRRVSGGRGEYELSGEAANGLRALDLVGHRLILDLGDGWLIDTDTKLVKQGGKPRIRRFHPVPAYLQVQRQLAAALLMPHPIREDAKLAGGLPILRSGRYAIEHVELSDNVDLHKESAKLVVQEIVLRNMSNHAEALHFGKRRTRLEQVWAKSTELPAPIHALLDQHRAQVRGETPIMRPAEATVSDLQAKVTEFAEDLGLLYRSADSDVLEDLEQALSLAAEPPEPPVQVSQIDPDETIVRRRVLKDWKRWANARGAASALFRQAVRGAYKSTCIVCGIHLPQTTMNAVPGVDAAHILPWADYDLDVVSNGLCLCKLHHWAFDEGLVVISEKDGVYSIEIPASVAAVIAAEVPQFSIEQLTQFIGVIPMQRLPHKVHERPNPVYLKMLAEAE
jgi:hypothetical protein